MSKITVTTIAGLTSGGDANTVKIESGDAFQVVSGATTLGGTASITGNTTVGGTLGVTGASTLTGDLIVDTDTLKVDTSNDRVGIGESAPGCDLVVKQSGSTFTPSSQTVALFQRNTATGSGCKVSILAGNNTAADLNFGDAEDEDIGKISYENNSNSMNFSVNATEVMSIQSDGAIKARANGAAEVGGIMHQFSNSGANTYTLVVTNVRDTSPIAHYLTEFKYPNFSPDNSTAKFLQCRDSTTARLNINSDGDVQNHDNSYGSISDIKLKEQISDASEQWDDIKALKIRKFKFKTDVATGDSDEHWRLGVIAQEVEASGMNKLITEEIDVDVDDEGKVTETGEKTKIVKYSILYMKAVKALQEAMARIETLESEVAKLKG